MPKALFFIAELGSPADLFHLDPLATHRNSAREERRLSEKEAGDLVAHSKGVEEFLLRRQQRQRSEEAGKMEVLEVLAEL